MPRDRDDGRPALDKDKEIRIPVALLNEPGVTTGALKVYGAIRTRMGFEAAASNFLEAWPSTDTIVKDAGVCRRSVVTHTGWLEQKDYILKEPGLRKSITFNAIVQRDVFLQDVANFGRAEAIHRYHQWRKGLADDSRAGQAKRSAERRTGQARRGKSAIACTDEPRRQARGAAPCTGGVQETAPGGARDCTGGVQPVAPDLCSSDLCFKNCVSENRGASDDALPAPPLSTPPPNGNGNHQGNGHGLSDSNGQGEQQAPQPRHRCSQSGGLLNRYRAACAECQEDFWLDRFYSTELRKLGLRPAAEREGSVH